MKSHVEVVLKKTGPFKCSQQLLSKGQLLDTRLFGKHIKIFPLFFSSVFFLRRDDFILKLFLRVQTNFIVLSFQGFDKRAEEWRGQKA